MFSYPHWLKTDPDLAFFLIADPDQVPDSGFLKSTFNFLLDLPDFWFWEINFTHYERYFIIFLIWYCTGCFKPLYFKLLGECSGQGLLLVPIFQYGTVPFVSHPNISSNIRLIKTGFRIRIDRMQIQIQHFFIIADPDPGFRWPNKGKVLQLEKIHIFLIKSCNLLIPRP
jgi:hypothetical protein